MKTVDALDMLDSIPDESNDDGKHDVMWPSRWRWSQMTPQFIEDMQSILRVEPELGPEVIVEEKTKDITQHDNTGYVTPKDFLYNELLCKLLVPAPFTRSHKCATWHLETYFLLGSFLHVSWKEGKLWDQSCMMNLLMYIGMATVESRSFCY